MGLCFKTLILVVVSLSSISMGKSKSASASKFNDCKSWKSLSLTPQAWDVAYDGFGEVQFHQDSMLLYPKKALQKESTHAALVLSKESLSADNFMIKVSYKNEKQLRSPAANPWEVFWLFFNYQPEKSEKKTNYFIFKPNGTELGTASGAIEQTFLGTTSDSSAEMGVDYELILKRKNASVEAFINGKSVLRFEDKKNQLFSHKGPIGLYTEDSQVRINSVQICSH